MVARPVRILLSTYDGARFVGEQLASLSAQTHPDWTLIWRDDGSHDATRATVAGFLAAHPLPVEEIGDGQHLGISASFWHLLRTQAPVVAREAAVVAFADQDDVWLPDKLARAVAALDRVGDGVPALYCASQTLVDARLREIGLSPDYGDLAGFPDALTQNIATGCTVALNAAAVALLARTHPPPGSLHDWWAYLVITAAGGTMIVDPTPVVLYRQHDGNAVGAPSSWLWRAIAALRRGPGVFMGTFRTHVAGLAEYGDLLTPQAHQTVRRLARGLRGGRLRRLLLLLFGPRLRRRTASETLLFRLWFVLG